MGRYLIAYCCLIVVSSIWMQRRVMRPHIWKDYGPAFVASWVLKATLRHLAFFTMLFLALWAVIQIVPQLASR